MGEVGRDHPTTAEHQRCLAPVADDLLRVAPIPEPDLEGVVRGQPHRRIVADGVAPRVDVARRHQLACLHVQANEHHRSVPDRSTSIK